MPRRSLTASTLVTSLPSTVSVPEVGSIIRLIIRIDVVLPQPEGPTNTVSVPSGTSSVRSSTATVPSGYFLVTFSNVIMALLLYGLVEAVVLDPLRRRLIGVDALVALNRRVESDQALRGQLRADRIQHGLELAGHLLRRDQGNDVGGQEHILGILQRHQLALLDCRRCAEDVRGSDRAACQRLHGGRPTTVTDGDEVRGCDVQTVFVLQTHEAGAPGLKLRRPAD